MYDVIEIPIVIVTNPETEDFNEETLEVEVNYHTDREGFKYDIIDYRMNNQSVELGKLIQHNPGLEKQIENAVVHYGFNLGNEK